MITTEQYFQAKPHSAAQELAAAYLLEKVNKLVTWAALGGFESPVCPNTGTQISGSKGGQGDGGFRLDTATTGGAHSSHKVLYVQQADGTWREDPAHAQAGVDVFDPGDKLDRILADADLERFGLYREHPDSTPGWCHLTDRPPRSGKRTFVP